MANERGPAPPTIYVYEYEGGYLSSNWFRVPARSQTQTQYIRAADAEEEKSEIRADNTQLRDVIEEVIELMDEEPAKVMPEQALKENP